MREEQMRLRAERERERQEYERQEKERKAAEEGIFIIYCSNQMVKDGKAEIEVTLTVRA